MSNRTVPEIQQEYQSLCVRAGHIQYQIYTLSKDLDAANVALRDLNIEAAVAKQKEDEKSKEAEQSKEEVKS